MKITLLTPALAAILGLALAGVPANIQAAQPSSPAPVATGAPTAAKPKKIEYKGTLTAVDAATNTITLSTSKNDPSKTLALTLSPKTSIQKDKKPATIADFAVGDKVTGSYIKDSATGAMTASSLHKTTTKTATAKTTAKPATSAPAPSPASAPAAQ